MAGEKLYTATIAQGRIILDAAGNPTEGYHIDFVTKNGARGFVEIPASKYSKESATKLLEAEAQRLEELLTL